MPVIVSTLKKGLWVSLTSHTICNTTPCFYPVWYVRQQNKILLVWTHNFSLLSHIISRKKSILARLGFLKFTVKILKYRWGVLECTGTWRTWVTASAETKRVGVTGYVPDHEAPYYHRKLRHSHQYPVGTGWTPTAPLPLSLEQFPGTSPISLLDILSPNQSSLTRWHWCFTNTLHPGHLGQTSKVTHSPRCLLHIL